MNRQILRITIPSIISNVTVPLLGLVDTAIVGHLGAPAYIGAIALGGMMFSLAYWVFSFLRMGTAGLTAQAIGAQNEAAAHFALRRALLWAFCISFVLIAAQEIIAAGALLLVHTVPSAYESSPEMERLAMQYFHILIWGAPAVLGLYCFMGWFLGRQDARTPMVIAITQNVINIAASLVFVFGAGWKVEGVAAGTLLAQYAGFLIALGLALHRGFRLRTSTQQVAAARALHTTTSFFAINRDLFLRTLCLVAVMTYFTASGAALGEITLAVNALLMQIFLLFSYIMDGFAYAGEALSGKFLGARRMDEMKRLTAVLLRWGWGLSAAFTVAYLLGGDLLVGLLTDQAAVRSAASAYLPYAVAIPFISFAAFLYDGLYIGITAPRPMLISIAVATACFFTLKLSLAPLWGNHALWVGFLAYLLMRGLIQWSLWRHTLKTASHL